MQNITVDENVALANVEGVPPATQIYRLIKYQETNKRRRLNHGAVEVTDTILAEGEAQLMKVCTGLFFLLVMIFG